MIHKHRRKSLLLAVPLLFSVTLLMPLGARAVPLPIDVDWFATTTVPPAFFWSGGAPTPASDGPFTFFSTTAVDVFVTDDFLSDDRFAVRDFGALLGLTSVPSFLDSGEKGPAVAFLDPDYSSGVFTVGPGAHSITIDVLAGSLPSGRGYIKAETVTVPEPGTVLLLGAGLAAIGFAYRRRAKKA